MRGLTHRRNSTKRAKRHARTVASRWGGKSYADDPKVIGKLASTHCRPCSCDLCNTHGNLPRLPGRQEIRAADSAKAQLREIENLTTLPA